MSTWGEGYKSGFQAGARKALRLYRADKSKGDREKSIKLVVAQIGKSEDGGPSFYAVANKCCGGVDAHDVGCK
ncbi:hypothetical protein [Neptuniibacter sp.]|uniref:hypothetical protein n=1 Tax=Neptuniibacter sp. TaxID=1962643 RepID=UPI0026089C65|nr:hypothetical protein [Neptuniibacter sp.]MCP4597039.1 hypothetical protein [Neptuniibacter sp.]